MNDKEFNLLTEPWIKVLKLDGNEDMVSLKNVYEHAHEYRALAGEAVTQDVAMLRFLLAVLHCVYEGNDANGKPLTDAEDTDDIYDTWHSLWECKRFEVRPIHTYLDKHSEHFWLVHPQYPFYQVSEFRKNAKVKKVSLNKLIGNIAESNNKRRLFNHRPNCESISMAEATRWLLNLQAWDDTSNKGGSGTGWLGQIGSIMIEGNNMFETLLLNLILVPDGSEGIWGRGEAIWERQPVNHKVKIPLPANPKLLLTLQSRCVKLRCKEHCVIGYVTADKDAGEYFADNNKHLCFAEQFTTWKEVGHKNKKEIVPMKYSIDKRLWQGFVSLITLKQQTSGRHNPGILAWYSKLVNERYLQGTRIVKIVCVGIEYGNMNMSVLTSVVDTLAYPGNLLQERYDNWGERIIAIVAVTDQLVGALKRFVSDIGLDNQHISEQTYARLDTPFRRWLININPDQDDIDEDMNQWYMQAQHIIRMCGKEIAGLENNSRYIRLVTSRQEKKRKISVLSVSEAYNDFLYRTPKQQDKLAKLK
ncbi:type I-E CRISPR-associated protein Cse1/CasA [Pectinatus frisingensis]|uniref:type I-E CRISPR-associated protein Cse1/CasA n=1 Tax=Pectinatus frisingensis TaxID=865 RepID=UPI0015F62D27|nr:type I-E CRISPR-associated protein Cse1/CasA [Pectinatus frisingensis]